MILAGLCNKNGFKLHLEGHQDMRGIKWEVYGKILSGVFAFLGKMAVCTLCTC